MKYNIVGRDSITKQSSSFLLSLILPMLVILYFQLS